MDKSELLKELLEAAEDLRASQRTYLEDRGNEEKGRQVGIAAGNLDLVIEKIRKED